MIGRRIFAGSILSCLCLGLLGCKVNSTPYHYKLSVEVETPEGARAGSSVIAVHMPNQLKGTEVLGGSGPSAQGEAVAIDLPGGKTLFALLRSQTNVDWAGSAHLESVDRKQAMFSDKEQYVEMLRNNRLVYPVQRWIEGGGDRKIDGYPMLVTFKDMADPKSVARVDPDNLAASFGAGYKLKAITVTGTDEPVTTGIGKRLGWLSEHPEPRLDPEYRGSTNPNISQQLSHGDFRVGTNK